MFLKVLVMGTQVISGMLYIVYLWQAKVVFNRHL